MKYLERFLPHLCLVTAVMLIVFLVTDYFNRAMAFINNDITKTILMVFSILVITESVVLIVYQRRNTK